MNSISIRQNWMAVLAKTHPEVLEQTVQALGELPPYQFLRPPEVGLVMVRGRAGGTGQQFNLGEMTVSRCVVQLSPPKEDPAAAMAVGFGYVAGRSLRHAELAAVCDALLQTSEWCDRVQTSVIAPLQASHEEQQVTQQNQTASTQVNFFNLVRGE
ncbi:MAG: phosphonate C-P lyase system protein PhnG [Leptolyngbyaceae bacterium]|nr:phosphonate C-P lyase system protein PhnG [Leptolyngbyaceae bacterium]